MIPDFLQYIQGLIALIGLLKLKKGLSEADQKKHGEALEALIAASDATKGYYAGREAGKGIDKEKEHKLATMWINCANKFKDYDEDLYRRFKLKRNYWLSPEDWTAEQVKAARIGLHDITREAEILLDPPKVTKRAKR